MVALASCGTDAAAPADSGDAGQSVNVDQLSSQTVDPLVGQWIGTWRSRGETKQAVLNIGKINPLRATLDVTGRCGADWVESSRTGNTVSVDATVTYGACSDNRWSVVLGDKEITASDPDNVSNSLKFTKQ